MTKQDVYQQREAERIRAGKDEARTLGLELLTPLAAAKLFQKSPEAIRKATRTRHMVVFDLWFMDNKVPMFRLRSAIEDWGEPDEQLVTEMRENGLTLGVDHLCYNILHVRPLLELRDPAEMAGEP